MTNMEKFFKGYNNEIYAKTKKYQKIYGFGLKDCKYDSVSSCEDV